MARRSWTVTLFCLGLAIATATPARSQDSNTDRITILQKQLDDLKTQMESIQSQINQLSKASEPPPEMAEPPRASSASSSQAVANATTPPVEDAAAKETKLRLKPKHNEVGTATSSYETDAQDYIAAPRIDNAPLNPKYPGYFYLPGTGTLLRIGGYFKTDFIYDLKPSGEPEKFIPSTFPIPPPVGVNNTTISIRPTRLNLDFLAPVASSSVRFFIEFDLFGSNATTPRLRHAYAQVANFLVGQSFSNFMDPDSGPDTLEFQGPNGQILIRNPQLRYSIPLAEKRSLRFSLEKASSDVSFKTPAFNSLPNSPSPDGAITFRDEFSSGHVQLSAVMRTPTAYLPDGRSDSVFGWGINLTGAMKVAGKDTFVYQGAYGAGYERYVNDTSGLGIDAAPKDSTHLKALPLTALYGAYQHYWIKQVRSSAVYGFAQIQNTQMQPGSAFHQSNYSAANLIWNPFGSLNVGTEFLYGWVTHMDKAKANAPRFMFSAKYNFIRSDDKKK